MIHDRHFPTKPFTLIKINISNETISALEYLLQEARSGNLIGLAYGAALREKDYFVHTTGEAYRNPMFGLSIASVLWRKLSDIEAGEAREQ